MHAIVARFVLILKSGTLCYVGGDKWPLRVLATNLAQVAKIETVRTKDTRMRSEFGSSGVVIKRSRRSKAAIIRELKKLAKNSRDLKFFKLLLVIFTIFALHSVWPRMKRNFVSWSDSFPTRVWTSWANKRDAR